MNECPSCRAAVPPHALRCPHCQMDLSRPVDARPPSRRTVMEPIPDLSDELIGRPEERGARPQGRVATTLQEEKGVDSGPVPGGGQTTMAFRPVHRPRMALLCILDDGKKDGEWIRIRGPRLVIGRSDADILIAHDDGISGRHAELERRFDAGYCWYLKDLGSTNGTFVRCGKTRLRNGQDFLIGSRRYRFHVPPQEAPGAADPSEAQDHLPRATRAVPRIDLSNLLPSVQHLDDPDGGQRRSLLTDAEHWIGGDPAQCSLVIRRDPMINPRHARLSHDPHGRWFIEDDKSLNGLWVRIIDEIRLERDCDFQLGEQRFLVRLP